MRAEFYGYAARKSNWLKLRHEVIIELKTDRCWWVKCACAPKVLKRRGCVEKYAHHATVSLFLENEGLLIIEV